jgi:hypothetical protein
MDTRRLTFVFPCAGRRLLQGAHPYAPMTGISMHYEVALKGANGLGQAAGNELNHRNEHECANGVSHCFIILAQPARASQPGE